VAGDVSWKRSVLGKLSDGAGGALRTFRSGWSINANVTGFGDDFRIDRKNEAIAEEAKF
jgi:hypothetical protein